MQDDKKCRHDDRKQLNYGGGKSGCSSCIKWCAGYADIFGISDCIPRGIMMQDFLHLGVGAGH